MSIDLRSDVLAPPTEAMWAAMREAETGWALVGEDRQVNELERFGAELLGKAAGLFVPTCSAANLVALMALAGPGGRVRTDAASHAATTERAGIERVARLSVCSEGPAEVLVLENTHNNRGGIAMSVEEMATLAREAAGVHVHLDGARLWNAAVALGVPAKELAASVDTVAVSLSKGLCAPYGALLAGPGDVIDRARRAAHHLGIGSVHRAGAFAAAALVALTTMVDRLAEDHRQAERLARGLAGVSGLRVVPAVPRTNIVLVGLPLERSWEPTEGWNEVILDGGRTMTEASRLVDDLKARGVLAMARGAHHVRFVTHRGIDDEATDRASQAVSNALATPPSAPHVSVTSAPFSASRSPEALS